MVGIFSKISAGIEAYYRNGWDPQYFTRVKDKESGDSGLRKTGIDLLGTLNELILKEESTPKKEVKQDEDTYSAEVRQGNNRFKITDTSYEVNRGTDRYVDISKLFTEILKNT